MQISNLNMSQKTQNFSYRDRVRYRFRQQILQIVNKYALSQLIIVLDTVSAFLLSNIFSITELVAMKIIYIEKLQVKRKKLEKHAIYFINPTKLNIQLLIKDFPSLAEQQIPQYKKIHILFTTFIQKGLLKTIALNKNLLKRIAKNSLKQFYFSTRILASNLIDLGVPYLGLAFSKASQTQALKREQICKKMIQYIANFDSINKVRIYYKKSPNMVCQKLAKSLESVINNYLGILLQNRSPNLNKDAGDLTILMLDRSIDTVTPFIHYFTYEALLFDFFTISMVSKSELKDKGSYSYQQIQNSIYDQYRYKHISQALANLPQALENEKGKLQSLKNTGHQTVSIRQLSQRIGQIKQNIQKLQAIWQEFQARKIEQLADLEQSIATGITSNSENTSSVKLISEVVQLTKNPNLNRVQKLRLAILCISCIKMSKQDYQTLLGQFNIEDKKILKNMISLGVSYDGSISKSTKTVTKDQQKIAQKRMQTTGMHLNRYSSIVQLVVPLFCNILEDPLNPKTVDKDVFGEIKCHIFKQALDQINFKRDRFAMTLIGGLSWSQVSAIRNVPELNNIVLMPDFIMTARQFLAQISKINILSQ